MAIAYECAACGHRGTTADKLAGRIVKCPRCQASVELPPAVIDPPSAVDPDAQEWRTAMLGEARYQSARLKDIGLYVGWILTLVAVAWILAVCGGLLSVQ